LVRSGVLIILAGLAVCCRRSPTVNPSHLADLLWTTHTTKGPAEAIYPVAILERRNKPDSASQSVEEFHRTTPRAAVPQAEP
jgi:hypothetical protein